MKFVGGSILLASFITQNFLYDKWSSESENILRAAEDQSLIEKSVFLNEIKFFTAGLDRESFDSDKLKDVREQYIREAARKTAVAQTTRILVSPLSDEQQKNYINQLEVNASKVKDFASMSDYYKFVNELTGHYNPQTNEYAKWRRL